MWFVVFPDDGIQINVGIPIGMIFTDQTIPEFISGFLLCSMPLITVKFQGNFNDLRNGPAVFICKLMRHGLGLV